MNRRVSFFLINQFDKNKQQNSLLCFFFILEFSRRLLSVLLIVYLINWFILFQIRPLPIYDASIDTFLTSTPCGRLIRSPNLTLTTEELSELKTKASLFFSTVKGCDLFSHQIPISTDELSYPLAFTILVHSNLQQFEFLLRTIYRSYNHYCVHVDSKSPLSFYQSIVYRSKCVKNIYVLQDRLNVSWGRFTVLEAEHLCQKELLKQSDQWKYYFNLANSDVPLKTNWELVRILKLYNNQNDITSLPYRSQLRQNNDRVNKTLPKSITLPLYKGEFHVLLTRQTVEYIHRNSRVADLYDYLNGTMVPDEHYYSIINRWQATPGYYPYDHDLSQINFMTRYKIWADRPEAVLCRGGFVRGICVFNYADLWHLATSPHFFANKVFVDRDRITPYCLSEYLQLRDNMKYEERDFSMINEEFYRQLKNVQYGIKK